ncbi:MAG: PTS sugar transporter subunit IIB [Lachnospiraceae bacterium]|nr:PTS sugar transporter subunit IIB [Lachnospiraceae bacterium]
MINLVRVDDRVLHGQTITMWLKHISCDGILIVDDDLFANKALGDVYRSIAPDGIRVYIFPVEEGIRKLKEAEKSQKNYIVIFRWLRSFYRVVESGYVLTKEINVGPASTRDGSELAVKSIYLIPDEIAMYEDLWNRGIKAYFQIIPSVKKVWWNETELSRKAKGEK